MIILTSELSDAALDWAVAKARGMLAKPWLWGGEDNAGVTEYYKFSTNWAQGGPIIVREISKIFRNVGGTWSAMILKDVPLTHDERGTSLALSRRAQWNGAGPTPLIAAMRCYVASKLGDQVDIPKELA